MDTTAQHMAARDDEDLINRLIAVAEQLHMPDPAGFVRLNLGRIISTDIGNEVTLTSVHAYAAQVYWDAVAALPPRPGLNPAAVTDAQLSAAVSEVWQPVTQGV